MHVVFYIIIIYFDIILLRFLAPMIGLTVGL